MLALSLELKLIVLLEITIHGVSFNGQPPVSYIADSTFFPPIQYLSVLIYL